MDNLQKLISALKRKIKRGDDYIIREYENADIEEASEALYMDESASESEKIGKEYWTKDVLESTRGAEVDRALPKSVTAVTNLKEERLSEVGINCPTYKTLQTALNAGPSLSEEFPPTDIDAIVKMSHENNVDGLERKLEEVKKEGKRCERKQPRNLVAAKQEDNGEFVHEKPEYWWDDEFARKQPTQSTMRSILKDFKKILKKYDTSTPYSSMRAGRRGRFNTSTPYSRMSTETHASLSDVTQSFVHPLQQSLYKEQGLRPANSKYLVIAFDCSDKENGTNEDTSTRNFKATEETSSSKSGDSTSKKKHMNSSDKKKH